MTIWKLQKRRKNGTLGKLKVDAAHYPVGKGRRNIAIAEEKTTWILKDAL